MLLQVRSWPAASPDINGIPGVDFDDGLLGDGLPELQSLLEAEHDGRRGERAGSQSPTDSEAALGPDAAGDDALRQPRVCLHATRSGSC